MTEEEQQLEDVLNGFRRILRFLRIAAVDTQSRFKISAAQLYVLDELGLAAEPLSMNELAARTMTDRTSVTGVVDRLVANRLVTRKQAAEDRRRIEISLTSAGKKLVARAPQAPTMQLIEALQRLSGNELNMMAIAMRRLLDELGLSQTDAGLLFDNVARTRGRATKKRQQ